MESDKVTRARKNEVGYCGDYCRKCHWYTDALRKPAGELSELVKKHFEVEGWIRYKGGNSQETVKGLQILSKCACAFNCKGGSGWGSCPVRVCNVEKGLDFCFECPTFPCETNWGEKSEHSNIFNARKIGLLREMKALGIEEWIKKQWE